MNPRARANPTKENTMNTRRIVTVLALIAVAMLSACTPEEIEASTRTGTVCAQIQSDEWSSAACAAAAAEPSSSVIELPIPSSPEPAATVCVELVPSADDDADNAVFRSWVGGRGYEYNEIQGTWYLDGVPSGYSLGEDGAIWATIACALQELGVSL
jgi:hypothetical protein